MTKQRTDNLELIILNDVDTDAFLPDYIENLGKINQGDKDRRAEIATLEAALTATTAYIDSLIQSRAFKDPVRVVATSNIAPTGPQTVDGASLTAGDRVLVAGQTDPSQNGWYTVGTNAWSRSSDANTSAEVKPGSVVWVSEGSNADSLWELTTDGPITLGSTALTFVAKSGNAANLQVVGSASWLKANALATAFLLTSNPPQLDSTNTAIVASTITWADGVNGTYSATLDSNLAVVAFVATYVVAGVTKTVTVTVPRNTAGQINASMTASVS